MPYNFSLANQPLPSVMRLRVPMRWPAASMPAAFLSKPSTARSKIDFSNSSELPNCNDLDFSSCAAERREVVKASCSVRLWDSKDSVWTREASWPSLCDWEKSAELVVAAADGWAWGLRDRSVELRFAAACCGAGLEGLCTWSMVSNVWWAAGAYEGKRSSFSASDEEAEEVVLSSSS